jgi:heme/copper-type cytochrome/quinol oxidase subunit 2
MLHRDLTRTILALVVGVAALVVVLVVTGVLAPTDTRDLSRYLQPFAGLTGMERVVVLVIAVVLAVLAASTVLSARTATRRGR